MDPATAAVPRPAEISSRRDDSVLRDPDRLFVELEDCDGGKFHNVVWLRTLLLETARRAGTPARASTAQDFEALGALATADAGTTRFSLYVRPSRCDAALTVVLQRPNPGLATAVEFIARALGAHRTVMRGSAAGGVAA